MHSKTSPQIIAFHLPQFHQIAENDRWWGNGFTDWTNVKRSRPRFRGHAQPSVPKDGYYYDLTDARARNWQADLAAKYGVNGFCYYHYWFNGRQLLEKPCNDILLSREPDFPFCFSWANESWTRSWDGGKHKVLMKQNYGSVQDWKQHFDYLLPFFRDSRYIRYNGCPIFLIYRPKLFADLPKMVELWNEWACLDGMRGISFVKTMTYFDPKPGLSPMDASVNFEPWSTYIRHGSTRDRLATLCKRGATRVANMFGGNQVFTYSYDQIWHDILGRSYGPRNFPGAFVGWDNTPRRGKHSTIIAGSTPGKFGKYMNKLIRVAKRDEAPFIFVNAWNEWAEGAYLEPDERFGYAYLENLEAAIKASQE